MKDQITPDVVRSNAESLLVWYGRDAEGEIMNRAKDCIASGQPHGAEIQMRIFREVRRLLKQDERGWMEKHYNCARMVAESEKRAAERQAERVRAVEEPDAAAKATIERLPSGDRQSEHVVMYVVDKGDDEDAKKAEALEKYRIEHQTSPDDTFDFICIRFVDAGNKG